MAKLKTFVTESGFFELAVAAPSMKAALRAWGFAHDAFAQGRAQQTDDAAVIAATTATPGTVLKRPIGSKAAFKAEADLPTVKGKPAKKIKTVKRDDRALKAAGAALEKAQNLHDKRLAALTRKRDTIEAEIAEAQEAWEGQRGKLKAAIRRTE
jgi:colicin import membrane protein